MTASVTVIVLTHDNFDDTMECLASIDASDYPDFTTVLVDNHSTDGSIEKIRSHYPSLACVDNPVNLGVAGGRNAGWRHVRAGTRPDYLLFLDNDTVLERDTISSLVAFIESRADAAIVCGKTYTAPPSTTIMSAGMKVNLYTGSVDDVGSGEQDRGRFDEPRLVPACGGFAFLVSTPVFEQLQGLDEDFNPYGWEDVDFCLRAAARGHRCYYAPSAVLYHKGCKIGRGHVPVYEEYKVKHFFLLLARHATRLQKLTCSLFLAARASRMLLMHVVHGEWHVIGPKLKGMRDALFTGRRLN